jgi:hypothetical protein
MTSAGRAESVVDQSRDRFYHRIAFLFVCVGLAFRAFYYLSDPPIWYDEAWLLFNLLQKNYQDLLGPLNHSCNGPPLFLWLERTAFLALGDHPLVWRLPAFVAGLLGLVLFYYVARRVLPPVGLPWAVGLYALSDRLLWHTVEVRPYAIDVCVAVAVLAAWLWTENWRLEWRLTLFTLASPVLLLLSYPAMFVCAGLGLVLLWQTWRNGRPVAWILLALCAAGMGLTVLWLLQGPVRAQREGMLAVGFTWTEMMPSSDSFVMSWMWPLTAVFEVMRFCLRPTGGLLIIVAALGARQLARDGRQQLLALLLVPMAGAMAAACLGRYPCGAARTMLFMTPAAALLLGAAASPMFRWVQGSGTSMTPTRCFRCSVLTATLVLAVIPMGHSFVRLFDPWPRADSRSATAFVRSHRRATDFIVPSPGEREYYYRGLESWCMGLPKPAECPPGVRFWVTLHSSLPGDETLGQRISAEPEWTVRQRKEYFHMTLLLVERADPAVSRTNTLVEGS